MTKEQESAIRTQIKDARNQKKETPNLSIAEISALLPTLAGLPGAICHLDRVEICHVGNPHHMTHRQHLNQLRAALNFTTRVAAGLEQEVQDGRAAEYEQRQGFEPGYIAGLAAGWRAHAGNVQLKIDTLKANHEKK